MLPPVAKTRRASHVGTTSQKKRSPSSPARVQLPQIIDKKDGQICIRKGGKSALPFLSPSESLAKARTERQNVVVPLAVSLPYQILKFDDLGAHSFVTDSAVPIDTPLFTPNHGGFNFVSYSPGDIFKAFLSLRNEDRVARRVRILHLESDVFSVSPAKISDKKSVHPSQKVSPGIETTFAISFCPYALVNYSATLIVATEREQYSLPLVATALLPLIEMTDAVDFKIVPVKCQSEKVILITNRGDLEAKIELETSSPFFLPETSVVVPINQSKQVSVNFIPSQTGHAKAVLMTTCANRRTATQLIGLGQEVDVSVSTKYLQLSDTPIKLLSYKSFEIANESDQPLNFSWRCFLSSTEETTWKHSVLQKMEKQSEEELLKNGDTFSITTTAAEVSSPTATTQDGYEESPTPLVAGKQRHFDSIARLLEDDKMLFHDDIFSIEPLEGIVWAKSSCNFTVSFTPKESLLYECIPFCDIAGK